MNIIRLKLAILSLFMYLFPCICGMIFININSQKKISVYDVNSSEILSMTLDEYLTGVVAAEMPAIFEKEALKAQSVAARTYLIKKEKCGKYANCQICTDSAHCQAYKNDEELKKQWGKDFRKYRKKISDAVNETRSQIIVYDNQPISAVFHSTSSGRTENSEDVWQSALPYLRSTESIEDIESPKYKSVKTISRSEFIDILSNYDKLSDGETELIGETLHTEGGSVDTIEISGKIFDGRKIRELFNLNSANFQITEQNDKITFDVFGYGHGVGMSQYGANYMAKKGCDYKEILHKYYNNTDIISIDEYISE